MNPSQQTDHCGDLAMIIERRKIDQVLNIFGMMTGYSRQKGIYGVLKSTGRNFSEILSDRDEIMDRAGVLQGGGKAFHAVNMALCARAFHKRGCIAIDTQKMAVGTLDWKWSHRRK